MSGGQRLWLSLGVWLGLGIFCSPAVAQPAFPPAQGPQFPAPQVESDNHKTGERFYFGVMGQVARPGVYELDSPQPELVDLLRLAGGMTRQATGQIRIVREGQAGQVVPYSPTLYFPLISGDIIVADAPAIPPSMQSQITPRSLSAIRNADYAEPSSREKANSLRHVALMNVLDRPVILPVPEPHANLAAVVAYLGQHSAIASTVQIQPVGSGENAKPFVVPTVLYFESPLLERERLPELPDVWRVGANGEILPQKRNAPAGRFQRPEVFANINPPAKQQISSRESIPTTQPAQETELSSDVPRENAETESEPQKTSWWTYAGLVLFVLLPVGAYVSRRRRRSLSVSSVIEQPPATVPMPTNSPVRLETSVQETTPPAPAAEALIREDILEALMFDRLPVLEESIEPTPMDHKDELSPSRKHFRLDPPEDQSAVKEPYIQKHSKRPSLTKTDPPESPPTLPLPQTSPPAPPLFPAQTDETRPGLSLLDRVLKRVHQNRAA